MEADFTTIAAGIGTVISSGALSAWLTTRGRERVKRLAIEEGEAKRVWARLDVEEKKRRTVEDRNAQLLTERVQLLSQVRSSTDALARATEDHRREIVEALERERRCEERIAALTERLAVLETKEDARSVRERRDSGQDIPAGGEQ